MKKIADFIVEKRVLLLILFIALAGICGALILAVNVNTDMTKYLPDKSSMKQGMDKMDEEFPDAEGDYTIRVMFKGLDEQQKGEMKTKLSEIKNVDKVDYKPDDADYNKDDYTKYVLHTKYDYESTEEQNIEQDIEANFSRNDMQFKNDSNESPGLPTWVIVTAVSLLMVILIIMSGSWIEPFLFLFTIGIAVAINMGTNVFLGEISDQTFSVASILQLVLSMDYSIILISRYRQELAKNSDRKQAMKSAIVGAFASISSSSLTTVVGLLALVFMSFKIGMDMGIVLAKGVFLSVVCVFLVLPGLILLCSRAIEKLAKPSPNIPTGGLAKFCNKARIPLTLCFVALFAAAYILQQKTVIAYSMTTADPIADIFPTTSSVVLLYDNKDDEKVTEIAEQLKNQPNVKAATNYTNMLGKQHTAAEMVDAVDDLSESMGSGKKRDINADESMFNMLYYKYYGGEVGKMTAGEFMRFLSQDVLTNESFRDYIGDDMSKNTEMMLRLSDKSALTKPLSPAEIAQFFTMEKAQCEQLFTYYFMQKKDVQTSRITAAELTNFVLNDLAQDKAYAQTFDQKSLEQMKMLQMFTDKNAITKKLTAAEIAQRLGMQKAAAEQMIGYYYSAKQQTSKDMTISLYDFVGFISANKQQFAQSADEQTLAKMDMLKGIMDAALGDVKLDEKQLAQMMSMEQQKAHQLLIVYTVKSESSSLKMSAAEFIGFLTKGVLADKEMSKNFTEENRAQLTGTAQLIEAVLADKEFSAAEMTQLFKSMSGDLDENSVELMYLYHDSNANADKSKTLSVEQLMNYLADTLVNDKTFKAILDDEMVADIKQSAADLKDGKKQLKGEHYSRLILSVTIPEEGEETDAFYRLVNEKCEALDGDYHLIGSSAMNYEMSLSFDGELLLITILTAVAIFIVVLITFRSAAVSAILVLLVQCGVYITVSVIGFQGYSIHFLALLIVQCILMGSTIDYGILFSNYYRESRKTCAKAEALKKAYKGSMHTILTSGLIMVTVTAILGQCFGDPTVEQICKTISIGAASAIMLIVFILPGILACLDRFTAGKIRVKE